MGVDTIVSPTTETEKRTGDKPRRYCGHHWEIDNAEGPVSLGMCRLCGATREFHNYLSDCLADKDKDKFEDWLAKHGRARPRRRGSLEVL